MTSTDASGSTPAPKPPARGHDNKVQGGAAPRPDASGSASAQMPEAGTIDMKLEVVTLPVSDVDRAKRFYQSLGWRLDADIVVGDAFRAVHLTPPTSVAFIAFRQ